MLNFPALKLTALYRSMLWQHVPRVSRTHIVLLCRERLSAHGTHQPTDKGTAPDLPDICSRHSRDASAVLQSSVDAVIAQVYCVSNCFVGADFLCHVPFYAGLYSIYLNLL